MSARWSDEAQDLVTATMRDVVKRAGAGFMDWSHIAVHVLTALADAGLLVEPGSETRTAPDVCDAAVDRWVCTLDHGHDGPHEAHGIGSVLPFHVWSDPSPTAPPPGAAPVSASSAAPGVQGGVPGPTPP